MFTIARVCLPNLPCIFIEPEYVLHKQACLNEDYNEEAEKEDRIPRVLMILLRVHMGFLPFQSNKHSVTSTSTILIIGLHFNLDTSLFKANGSSYCFFVLVFNECTSHC